MSVPTSIMYIIYTYHTDDILAEHHYGYVSISDFLDSASQIDD